MRAKVKTTVIDTGQEYLLLVAKMNLKGILVNTSQMLKPNTQLMLELKLNEQEPILLKGYVHKISEETSSKKGMVIAFSNPTDESKRKIQRFIDDSKEISAETKINTDEAEEKKKSKWTIRKKKEKQPEAKPVVKEKKAEKVEKPVEQNKTMIVGEDDLPSMMLSSPDNSKALSVATMDEESLHAKNPGLSGSTRHVKLDSSTKKKVDRKPFRMTTIYKAFGFVVTVIVLVLATKPFLNIMDKRFGKKITLPSFSGSSSTSNKAPQTSKPGEPAASTAVSSLDTIQVEDQGGFLKISVLGKGNFANNKISKLTNPNRIQIELLEIPENKSPATTAVNNNPISKINVSKGATNSTVVDVFYTGKEPPNFEAKVYNNSMDIFIYR